MPFYRISASRSDLERVPIGSKIEVVGYFSHKSPRRDDSRQ